MLREARKHLFLSRMVTFIGGQERHKQGTRRGTATTVELTQAMQAMQALTSKEIERGKKKETGVNEGRMQAEVKGSVFYLLTLLKKRTEQDGEH